MRSFDAASGEGRNRVDSLGQWDEVRPRIDRVSYVRAIQVERTCRSDESGGYAPAGTIALSINMSSQGLCLLLEWPSVMGEVLRVHMPTPVMTAQTPTLANVRWARPIIFHGKELSLAGLKFLL